MNMNRDQAKGKLKETVEDLTDDEKLALLIARDDGGGARLEVAGVLERIEIGLGIGLGAVGCGKGDLLLV